MDGSLKTLQIRQRDKICFLEKLLAEKWSFKTDEVRREECANKLDEILEDMHKETIEAGTKRENMRNSMMNKNEKATLQGGLISVNNPRPRSNSYV